MNISINLLKESQHLQARLRRMGLMLQTGSLVVLVAFAAVVFFTISYLVWSQTQANRLNSDIAQAKAGETVVIVPDIYSTVETDRREAEDLKEKANWQKWWSVVSGSQ